MAVKKQQEPIYNRKVNKILNELKEGRTREEISEEFDYSTWRSLDMYMRRKGFKYDARKETYLPDIDKDFNDSVPEYANSKVSLIISLFDKGDKEASEIAKQTGFDNHRELSTYMKNRGYKWDSIKENYVMSKNSLEEESKNEKYNTTKSKKKEVTENEITSGDHNGSNVEVPVNLIKYLPLLEKLLANKEQLERILSEKEHELPRYNIPGAAGTKGFYMNKRVTKLVEEFCDVKNVSQREMAEGALIEYLKRYGFKEEVKTLLGDI